MGEESRKAYAEGSRERKVRETWRTQPGVPRRTTDRPLSRAAQDAVAEGRADHAAGRTYTAEEVR